MPIGPNGERRPTDPVANGVLIGKIATGLATEKVVDPSLSAKRADAAKARAAAQSAEKRAEIARKAANARWGK